jgi:hypothetical protein
VKLRVLKTAMILVAAASILGPANADVLPPGGRPREPRERRPILPPRPPAPAPEIKFVLHGMTISWLPAGLPDFNGNVTRITACATTQPACSTLPERSCDVREANDIVVHYFFHLKKISDRSSSGNLKLRIGCKDSAPFDINLKPIAN